MIFVSLALLNMTINIIYALSLKNENAMVSVNVWGAAAIIILFIMDNLKELNANF